MKKTWTLMIVTVVAAAFLATPCLAKTTWNANSVWPPKNNHSVGLTEFAEKVKKATNGELELGPGPQRARFGSEVCARLSLRIPKMVTT